MQCLLQHNRQSEDLQFSIEHFKMYQNRRVNLWNEFYYTWNFDQVFSKYKANLVFFLWWKPLIGSYKLHLKILILYFSVKNIDKKIILNIFIGKRNPEVGVDLENAAGTGLGTERRKSAETGQGHVVVVEVAIEKTGAAVNKIEAGINKTDMGIETEMRNTETRTMVETNQRVEDMKCLWRWKLVK